MRLLLYTFSFGLLYSLPLWGEPRSIEAACLGLYRTLAVEPEFQPLVSWLYAKQNNSGDILQWAGKIPSREELGFSSFNRLFAFYGKNRSGHFEKNLIPDEVYDSKPFQEFLKSEGRNEKIVIKRKNGRWYLENFDRLHEFKGYFDRFLVFDLMRALMEARGKGETNLKLRKDEAAWRDKTTPMDRLIPTEVAEEWRDDKFVNIEFPMEGYVEKGADIRAYRENLYRRLWIFTITRRT